MDTSGSSISSLATSEASQILKDLLNVGKMPLSSGMFYLDYRNPFISSNIQQFIRKETREIILSGMHALLLLSLTAPPI